MAFLVRPPHARGSGTAAYLGAGFLAVLYSGPATEATQLGTARGRRTVVARRRLPALVPAVPSREDTRVGLAVPPDRIHSAPLD